MNNDYIVLDCEVYPNYFLVAFKNIATGQTLFIEAIGENSTLSQSDNKKLRSVLTHRTTFGFNSENYDMLIMLWALRDKTCLEIYNLSELIISGKKPVWMIKRDLALYTPKNIKHFDIKEPAPGVMVSLKLYGARMHSKKLQDLPIEPGSILTPEEIEITRTYCINDLDTTIDLYEQIKNQIELRFDMSKEYQTNLTSKSDAQIAEVVIKSELQKLNPRMKMKAPKLSDNITFKYKAPDFIKFQDPQLVEALEIIQSHNFGLDGRGSIKLPKELSRMKIALGHSVYQMGLGGIHSTEKAQSIIPTSSQFLIDKDVASYYPAIILNLGLYPVHLGPKFLDVYKTIVAKRLEAKHAKNDVVNKSLKIVINGSFGKLGSKYSALYSPDLMMTVTLTGQLSLLMLIEKLENNGINVVSANTDGFVSLLQKDAYKIYDAICFDWEIATGFELEETKYKGLFSRDINNYLALTDYDAKGKGIFSIDEPLRKNPEAIISIKAVIEYLTNKTPVAETIRGCEDIREFILARTANGGAVWKDQYLGKVARWVYSTRGHSINYKRSGNQVAKSAGAYPVMELGPVPEHIDYDRYTSISMDILEGLGQMDL